MKTVALEVFICAENLSRELHFHFDTKIMRNEKLNIEDRQELKM